MKGARLTALRVEGVGVDEVTKELEFHQRTITGEGSSPLHLIREKEIEISGRLLAAKREADEIVARARREASEIVTSAQDDATRMMQERHELARRRVEEEAAEVRAQAQRDVAALEESIAERTPAAVSFVVESVLRI